MQLMTSVQSLSRVRLFAYMDCSTPGFPVRHQLLELAQTHVHRVSDKLKPTHIYLPPNPRALKNHALSTLHVLNKSSSKAWMRAPLLTTWFTEYFQPMVETYCSGKRVPFKVLLLTDKAPGDHRALIEMHNETHVVFTPVETTSVLPPKCQGHFDFQVL